MTGDGAVKRILAGIFILMLISLSGCSLERDTDTGSNDINIYNIDEKETTTTTRAYEITAATTTPRPDPVKPSEEAITAEIRFYDEPTEEYIQPNVASEVQLTSDEAERLKQIINGVEEWRDDRMVDRLTFFFSGEIEFSHSDMVYYFEYQYNDIYYDHYFGQISEEDMAYIKGFDTQSAEVTQP